jgi:replicative superfamily II helicase
MRLRDLMRRGVAVHHAGLLPIMKETVEMLFCQGYIKVGGCGVQTWGGCCSCPTAACAVVWPCSCCILLLASQTAEAEDLA